MTVVRGSSRDAPLRDCARSGVDLGADDLGIGETMSERDQLLAGRAAEGQDPPRLRLQLRGKIEK